MNNLILNLMAKIQSEKGQFNLGGGGILGLVLVILLILCAVVFLWINIDVNEK